MNFYYDVFGGSLRNLRSAYPDVVISSEEHSRDAHHAILSQMDSFFGGWQLARVSEETWHRTAIALADHLKVAHRRAKTCEESLTVHTICYSVVVHSVAAECGGSRDVPATRFMRHLAGYVKSASASIFALRTLKSIFERSGIGCMHEHDAHQFRLQHLGNEPGIMIWSLEGSQSKRLCLPIKRVLLCYTLRHRKLSD